MIEIIREKVIMANNPECTDLIHALELEFKYKDCLVEVVKHFDLDDENVMNDYESITICTKELWQERYDCSLEQYQQRECGGDPFCSIKRIIGRCLSLERILVALNKQNEDYAYSNGKIMLLDVRDDENDYHNEIICEWQPSNTIENQSNETIKTIYDILCV